MGAYLSDLWDSAASGEQPTTKRKQHCPFCNNHGINRVKKGHVCEYKDCPCMLCQLTAKAQVTFRLQQARWRHQELEMAKNKLTSRQLCAKCRNHEKFSKKHGLKCEFADCNCALCLLTDKCRLVMKLQMRVRREKVTSEISKETDDDEDSNGHGGSQNDGETTAARSLGTSQPKWYRLCDKLCGKLCGSH
ncbi:protein male abnormal 3-like [Hyalella azteca]|uniref:Protein male abnormal 3-like n=1 Tax=Hyalella azteca TaxID=294128 RepID=A0A8B7PFC4_HYAAZ|nr:protein male abnormal 3-like [Hyalella azteca]